MISFSLVERAVLSFEGEDHISFLQGLVTQDVQKLKIGGLSWGGFLTPQGRVQYLFFIYKTADALFIECCASDVEALLTQLKRFKLRSKVEISRSSHQIWVGEESDILSLNNLIIAQCDPRAKEMGWRALVASSDEDVVKRNIEAENLYLEKRLSLGLPEQNDVISGEALVLEMNMDYLGGVSWEKGCYIGQEVTARTHYRGLIKKRLFPVSHLDGVFSEEERKIFNKEGKEVGVLRSFFKNKGLILLHRDAWEESKLFYQGREVEIHKFQWSNQDEGLLL